MLSLEKIEVGFAVGVAKRNKEGDRDNRVSIKQQHVTKKEPSKRDRNRELHNIGDKD